MTIQTPIIRNFNPGSIGRAGERDARKDESRRRFLPAAPVLKGRFPDEPREKVGRLAAGAPLLDDQPLRPLTQAGPPRRVGQAFAEKGGEFLGVVYHAGGVGGENPL